MFLIAYAFKGQVHVFAGQVKIVSHSSCRASAILKYFCPLMAILALFWSQKQKLLFFSPISSDWFIRTIAASVKCGYYFTFTSALVTVNDLQNRVSHFWLNLRLLTEKWTQSTSKDQNRVLTKCVLLKDTAQWHCWGSSLFWSSPTSLRCPWARHINPCLVLAQPRKTRPDITEKLLTGT